MVEKRNDLKFNLVWRRRSFNVNINLNPARGWLTKNLTKKCQQHNQT